MVSDVMTLLVLLEKQYGVHAAFWCIASSTAGGKELAFSLAATWITWNVAARDVKTSGTELHVLLQHYAPTATHAAPSATGDSHSPKARETLLPQVHSPYLC